MGNNYRVLAVGGDRAVLVGLARAFQGHGCTFAAASDPARLVDSAARFSPHVVLVFGHPSPEEAMRRVAWLRADPRFAVLPIVLVASLPPKSTPGVSLVVPDPSDVGEFAARLIKLVDTSAERPPAPPPVADVGDLEEIAVVEEIESLSARILLVDDDPALVKLFSVLMKKSGFEVLTAGDGQEGLAVALEKRPDLVIADLNMPRLDGWGLLRAIRADHRIGETPLVFLSCHDDYRENLKALTAGAQDYVAKGGRLDALVTRVRKLLAPRDVFLGALMGSERIIAQVQEVGVQWALRNIAAGGGSGVMQVRDPFWNVAIGIAGGAIVYARAQIAQHMLEGPSALPPIVVIRSGELLFDPTARPPSVNVQGDLEKLLEDAALRNNANESQALDRLLTQANKVEVDQQLYEIYEQLGPPSSRPIAALVLQGLTPREVIARADASPTEVEDTLRDLVRRRVLRLSA